MQIIGYSLRPPQSSKNPRTTGSRLSLSGAQMRCMARRWHHNNTDFTLSALHAIGRCKSKEETDLALAYQNEALAIGF